MHTTAHATDAALDQATDTLLNALALDGPARALQAVQTRHRLNLVRAWGLAAGERVLELGCGQGDTTAALAWAVGPRGQVLAVDPAPPDFGAPTTLGDATAALTAALATADWSAPVKVVLGEDGLLDPQRFAPRGFDQLVLSHCAWYFASQAQWTAQLRVARSWAQRLCLAEWDLQADAPSQWAHALAVLLQAQQEAWRPQGQANVRTLMSVDDLLASARAAGWQRVAVQRVPSAHLQDGQWEVALAADPDAQARDADLPEHPRQLLTSQRGLMQAHAQAHGTASLDTLVITAVC